MIPRWTVLLPTHNSPDTLRLAIDSVLDQTDADLELLIVGDGCGDDTRAVVAERDDPRIRFVDAPKTPGFGYVTRRSALEQTRSEYVAFISDDDLFGPHHLAALGEQLERHDIAYSRPIWCVPPGELVPFSVDLNDPAMRVRFAEKNYIPSVFWGVRRAALEGAGGWPVHVASAADWTLWRAILAMEGSSLGYTPEATAVHFRARRRAFDHDVVAAILTLPDRSSWWPAAASLASTAQHDLAVSMRDREWWRALGGAVTTIEHHLTMEYIDGIVHAPSPSAAESARLEVHEMYARTISWRVTRPLRAIRRWVS